MLNRIKDVISYRMTKFKYRELELTDRLSILFLLTGFSMSLLAFFVTLGMNAPWYINLPNLLLAIACLVLPFLFDELILATKVSLFVVGFIYFPFVFFTNGGDYGSAPLYFVLISAYLAFYFNGKTLIFTTSTLLIYYLVILLVGHFNPSLIVPYADETSRFIELIIAVISVSLVITIIASATFTGYKTEYELSHNLMNELEKRNDELKELSIKDQLTGVYNRRHFEEVLQKGIRHYEKYNQHFYVLMIDLDDFKIVNDTYGHLFGDEVLRKIANEINKSTRDYDVIARYGGEEFCVVVSHLNPDDGTIVAERIRLHVEELELRNDIKMTVSVGITMNKDGDTPTEIIKRADEKLYLAKSSGKNCVK